MSSIGARREAFASYHFLVEISGIPSGHFRACSGLKSEAEVVAVQAGGVNSYEHKLIGRTKLANIVLKRGFAGPQLWSKRQSFVGSEGGGIKRFHGSIIQLGPGGKKVHEWQFNHAWICKWEGPEFDANKNEISVETIEIAHEGLAHVKASTSLGSSAVQSASANSKNDAGRSITNQSSTNKSTSDQETLNVATDIIRKSQFAQTPEGKKIVARIELIAKVERIKFADYKGDDKRGAWTRRGELEINKKYNRDPEATASEIVHEATHAQHEVDFPNTHNKLTIDEEMRTNANQLELYKEQRERGYFDKELELRLKAQKKGKLRDDVRERYDDIPESL